MRLRPRYSLLTLLVLTALVAGGVKLWHGPHHVLEKYAANAEVEYSYVRDWHGNNIRIGPRVNRYYDRDGTTSNVYVNYYRVGELTGHEQELRPRNPNHEPYEKTANPPDNLLPLSKPENAEYQAAIGKEIARLKELGYEVDQTIYVPWKPPHLR